MLVDLIEHFIALELLIDDFFIAGDSYKRLIYFSFYELFGFAIVLPHTAELIPKKGKNV